MGAIRNPGPADAPAGSGGADLAGTGSHEDGYGIHARCFACGAENPHGLKLHFEEDDGGGVIARCVLDGRYQGFEGIVQGGIVSLLLDSAMANCLFRRGVQAMTARLGVRFHRPLGTGTPLVVRAVLAREARLPRGREVFFLDASVEQDGVERASAKGTFVRIPPPEKERRGVTT